MSKLPCPMVVVMPGRQIIACNLDSEHHGPCIDIHGMAITVNEIHPMHRATFAREACKAAGISVAPSSVEDLRGQPIIDLWDQWKKSGLAQ